MGSLSCLAVPLQVKHQDMALQSLCVTNAITPAVRLPLPCSKGVYLADGAETGRDVL